MMHRVLGMLRALVTRGRIVSAVVGARTVVQITGLDGETFNGIEMLLPPGYSARPAAGADGLILQVLGSRDHLVVLGGDTAGGDAIADLASGENGLRNNTGSIQLVMRNTGTVEITGNVKITGSATIDGNLLVVGDITGGDGSGDQIGLRTHTHPVLNVQTGSSNITTSAPNAGS